MLRRLLTMEVGGSVNLLLRKSLISCPVYPFGGPTRAPVPDDKVDWRVGWGEYNPPDFTIPGILKGDKPWADPELGSPGFVPNFNQIDGKLDRRSYAGKYLLDGGEGRPLNPVGRTGLNGRGSLGKWGPNHAADCIVTRWKIEEDGSTVLNPDKFPVIQFIAIRRQDSGDVAIPGGMIDPGETPLEAAQREFVEEVMGADDWDSLEESLKNELKTVFSEHNVVEKTYVDDRRNTDNAWIETCAINFHLSKTLSLFSKMKFKSGSDAREAFWIDYEPNMNLYASHGSLMKKAVSVLYEKWNAGSEK